MPFPICLLLLKLPDDDHLRCSYGEVAAAAVYHRSTACKGFAGVCLKYFERKIKIFSESVLIKNTSFSELTI